jgi:hypothetical protein
VGGAQARVAGLNAVPSRLSNARPPAGFQGLDLPRPARRGGAFFYPYQRRPADLGGLGSDLGRSVNCVLVSASEPNWLLHHFIAPKADGSIHDAEQQGTSARDACAS